MEECDNKTKMTESSLESWVFREAMDKLNANIYVTDIETDQILFMNKRMRDAFGFTNPEGRICWQVFQNDREERCDFCPLFHLDPEDSFRNTYIWESENQANGRTYEYFDSLISWPDGRTVHFQYAVDITDMKNLSLQARTDELTGMLNRRGGKTALEASMKAAHRSEELLTVAMIDANELKLINDRMGHSAGDQWLVSIANELGRILDKQEYLFRLGGDEFVAVFTKTSVKEATRKLKEVLSQLKKNMTSDIYPKDAFCFGVVNVDFDGMTTVDEVINAADEKLYEYKRIRHIDRANEKISDKQDHDKISSFVYNKDLLYDALAQSTDDYLYVCNMKTGVFRYSQAMVDEFALPGQVIENAAAVWGARVHEHDRAAFLESNQEITDGRTDCHCVEYRAKNHEGKWVWVRCRGHLERDENGEPELFAGFITNLGNKNRVDHLTGLFNKFEFVHQIEQLAVEDQMAPFVLMHLGLDNLKRVNDLYDRHFGDEVIRIAAQKLQSLLPDNGMIFRLDGDEFAVILFGEGSEMAETFYSSVQRAFSHQHSFENKKYHCSISCGCVTYPEHLAAYMELIKYAGYALNCAKQNGKNQICFFSREMLVEKTRLLRIEEALRDSIDNDFKDFELYYQPVFNREKKLIGAECLCRWASIRFGRVGPDEFIPILEKNGLIIKLGRWVFEEAVKKCSEWKKSGYPIKISVNLSAIQLGDEGLLDFIQSTIEKYQANPRLIVLELTESYFANNADNLSLILSQCREMDIAVAIDDFGTGYSSLGLLKSAPADVVKIDKAFIEGLHESDFDRKFVSMIADLCHVIGMNVCIEGVETEEDFEAIKAMDIQYIQGYYLGRPVPKRSFEEMFLIKF